MGFTKLDSGIIHSSIWSEELSVRVVWITMLALKDESGFVGASVSGIQRAANVSMEECLIALEKLLSPDTDSRTSDFEGRRIEKIDGGFIVLNNDKYRMHSDTVKEQTRSRVRKFREKNQNSNDVTQCNVTGALHSVSVSVSESVSEEKIRNQIPPSIESIVEYCNQRQNNIIPQKFFDHYQSKGWMVGRTKMKDWQAAIRTWESSGFNDKGSVKTGPKNCIPLPDQR